MKNLTILLILTCLSIFNLKAQTTWTCATVYTPQNNNSNQTQTSPSTCINFLNDFVPHPNDPEIEINIRVWVFAPSSNSLAGVWTHSSTANGNHITTQADAINCINDANTILSNIPAPNLTVAGVSHITNSKIKLVLKSFNYVLDNEAYWNLSATAYNTNNIWHINDDAINVYLAANSQTYVVTNTLTVPTSTYISWSENEGMRFAPVHGIFPYNYIALGPIFDCNNSWGNCGWDNMNGLGGVLAHELGHLLGLHHSTGDAPNSTLPCCTGEPYSSISPTFGCCGTIEANDYVLEPYQCNTSNPIYCYLQIPNTSCTDPGTSNNLMSQNAGCNKYLSPHQMAVMHHNLRTTLKNLLSINGYDAATSYDPYHNYTLSSNETWYEDRYMKGNITIPADKTLIIKCSLAMTHGAKITVNPKGQLIIDGGHVTNISGRMWKGIQVRGNPNQAQLVSNSANPGSTLYQGIVRIKNNATISNAEIGIKNYLGSWTSAGGVILAENSNFINNNIDADFQGNYFNNVAPLNSASRFTNCKFITENTTNTGTINTHINIYKTNGIQLKGCTFQYTTNALSWWKGNGITSVDSYYEIDSYGASESKFVGLHQGIRVNNINPLRVPVIKNTKFIDNTQFAAYVMNANYLSFTSNTIQPLSTSSGSEGLYLNNCKYYNIRNNVFAELANYHDAVGISLYKSGAGAHQIYRNEFGNLDVAINCMDDNSGVSNVIDGLKMNCNVFNTNPNLYDIALTYTSGLNMPTVMRNQGETGIGGGIPSSSNVVRNIYGASCGNQNMWYVSSSYNTSPIQHGSNTNTITAITQPTPQSSCSSSTLNIVDANINLDYPNHCPSSPFTSGGTATNTAQKLVNLNGHISELKASNEDNVHHFDIQSSVASKLNLFLTDTNEVVMDSVITILERNDGNMEDAAVQRAFAYMAVGNYNDASMLAYEMETSHPAWTELLVNLIELEQDTTLGIYGLQSDVDMRNFYESRATYGYEGDNSVANGGNWALGLLHAACGNSLDEPHARPTSGGARGINSVTPSVAENMDFTNNLILYPNPASETVNFSAELNSKEPAIIYIFDLSGRLVEQTELVHGNSKTISTKSLSNGVYIVKLKQNNKTLQTHKLVIVKQ